MPKEKTKFEDRGLSEIDANGETLKSWCSKSSSTVQDVISAK